MKNIADYVLKQEQLEPIKLEKEKYIKNMDKKTMEMED